MKKNIMVKMLVMIAAVVALTGCANQNEDISAILKDGIGETLAAELSSSTAVPDVEAEAEPVSTTAPVVEAEPKATTAPAEVKPTSTTTPAEVKPTATTTPAKVKPTATTAPAKVKPTATTAPAEVKPTATTAPAAGTELTAVFKCSCGFTAATAEEIQNHMMSEMLGSGTGTQPVENTHEHVWQEHSNQRWVPKIVTVVDEPAQYEEYSIYRMYWYDTNTWEETRDHTRFDIWSEDRNGGLWLLYNNYEDSPLFLGYNDQGGYSLTGDHAIMHGYECISPEVTHEEDQGYYETYVDYYYCDCGATKSVP